MKEYVNYASKFRIMIIFINIVFLFGIILRICTYDESDFISTVVIIFGFIVILLLLDLYFITMKDIFNLTKYDDEKIVNRFIFKKKTIYYSNIKQLVFVGNCIIVLDNDFDFHKINKKGNVIKRYFAGKIMFYLDDKEDILLKIACNSPNCKLYIIGKSSKISKKVEKFFETIIV